MPITSLVNPVFISTTGAGRVNSGGSVEVYVADGLFTTYATIYSDQVKTTELANPITLDDAGTKEIWYDVKVDIREKTSSGVLIRDTLNLDPNAGNAVVQGFNLAQNGSFEIDEDNDGQPDNWTISPYSGSAIAITSTIVTDGTKALEFNTGGVGSGGGTATSAKLPVTEGSAVSVSFSFYATNATTTNTFQIKWYDENNVLKSTSTVTMPASGSVPTSWTGYQEVITADAAATQGEIVLTGISSGGSNLSSKAYFDGIEITSREGDLVTLEKTQEVTNKTATSLILKTGVSGTAVDTDVTLAANSNTLIAPQKAVKAYIDSKVLTGRVNADGTTTKLPTGWSVTYISAGQYKITHSLNTQNTVIASPVDTSIVSTQYSCYVFNHGNNSFSVRTWLSSSTSPGDIPFHFMFSKD